MCGTRTIKVDWEVPLIILKMLGKIYLKRILSTLFVAEMGGGTSCRKPYHIHIREYVNTREIKKRLFPVWKWTVEFLSNRFMFFLAVKFKLVRKKRFCKRGLSDQQKVSKVKGSWDPNLMNSKLLPDKQFLIKMNPNPNQHLWLLRLFTLTWETMVSLARFFC